MSGFTASNSRIQVVETVNNVDETVFDTDNDMPHIVGVSYISGVAVDFDDLTQTETYVGEDCVGGFETDWYWVFTPSVWYPFFTFVPSQWTPFYNWTNSSYERTYTPSSSTFEREYTPSSYDRETETTYNDCKFTVSYYRWSVDAEEYSSTTNIGTLPTDEDGNAIDVDFITVQATGVRTTAGKDPRFNQALPTTVPSKTFSFQGSVLLESSGKANGNSWFRRIMSVYPSGNNLKLKVQESVATLVRGAYDSSFPHINDTRSTYSFNFKVFFGKFRQ